MVYLNGLIMNNFWAKCILGLSAFLLPLAYLSIFIIFIIWADFITGVWASNKRKEKITSNKMRATVYKTMLYFVCLWVVFGFEKIILNLDGILMTQYSMGFIILNEMFSILENVSFITGNNNILNIKGLIKKVLNRKADL